uniref:Uncharacterized protein n=1 Tax=Xiphophorus couchianus TaxID=32473 RepID=A0A3B5L0X4_9TELE
MDRSDRNNVCTRKNTQTPSGHKTCLLQGGHVARRPCRTAAMLQGGHVHTWYQTFQLYCLLKKV